MSGRVVMLSHTLMILTVLVGGLIHHHSGVCLTINRVSDFKLLNTVSIEDDIDTLHVFHEQKNGVVDVPELLPDCLSPLLENIRVAVITKKQRNPSEPVREVTFGILPDRCNHTHPRIAGSVLKEEREIPGLNMNLVGCHENRLETDALLSNIALSPCLGALADIANCCEILQVEAVFVTFHDDAV